MLRNSKSLKSLYEGYDTIKIKNNVAINATAESGTILVRAAATLAKELSSAMVEKDPVKRLELLEKTLADTRRLRSEASAISDDDLSDYAWSMLTCWWKGALKYGIGTVKNSGDINSTTRNSTLDKFDGLITFLRTEIAKTKLEIAQEKKQTKTELQTQ